MGTGGAGVGRKHFRQTDIIKMTEAEKRNRTPLKKFLKLNMPQV